MPSTSKEESPSSEQKENKCRDRRSTDSPSKAQQGTVTSVGHLYRSVCVCVGGAHRLRAALLVGDLPDSRGEGDHTYSVNHVGNFPVLSLRAYDYWSEEWMMTS